MKLLRGVITNAEHISLFRKNWERKLLPNPLKRTGKISPLFMSVFTSSKLRQGSFQFSSKKQIVDSPLCLVLTVYNFDWRILRYFISQSGSIYSPRANGGFENVEGLIAGGFSLILLGPFPLAFLSDFGPGFRAAIFKTIARNSTLVERSV